MIEHFGQQLIDEYAQQGKLSRSRVAMLKEVYARFHEWSDVNSLPLTTTCVRRCAALGVQPLTDIECVAVILDKLRPSRNHPHVRLIETTNFLKRISAASLQRAQDRLASAPPR